MRSALVVLFIGCLVGCKTTTHPAQTSAAGEPAAEEVRVHSMGSWIPRKVKAKKDIIADGTTTTDAKMLERANAAGRSIAPKSAGN